MNCAECQNLINAYLDDELEEHLQAGLASHLSDCRDCSRKVASLKASIHRLRETFPEQAPPPELWDKIRAKTEVKA